MQLKFNFSLPLCECTGPSLTVIDSTWFNAESGGKLSEESKELDQIQFPRQLPNDVDEELINS